MDLLRADDRPTAVFAANDLAAVGVLAAADELGLRVPEDLSVAGYDDDFLSRMRRIALTTVNPHITDVGREAAEVLVARLSGDERSTATRLLKPTLVVRSTTGPAPAA